MDEVFNCLFGEEDSFMDMRMMAARPAFHGFFDVQSMGHRGLCFLKQSPDLLEPGKFRGVGKTF